MLQINNLSKSFKKKTAIDNFSYEFKNGVYVILGPNGSGKTTLLRCISNVYPVSKGVIMYEKKDVLSNKDFFKNLGYLSQSFGTFKDLSVREVMCFFASLKGVEKSSVNEEINRTIELVNLFDRINDKVYSLSGGMIRRLGIAQAILGEPRIILLDEPTTGLDPEECLKFKNTILDLKKDKIIIISTHNIESVESLCDTVLVMNKGKLIASGSPKDISEYASNKVYIFPSDKEHFIKGKYFIEKKFTCDNEVYLRVLSNVKQVLSPTTPTLEDGYLCLINRI